MNETEPVKSYKAGTEGQKVDERAFVAPCRELKSNAPLNWLKLGWADLPCCTKNQLDLRGICIRNLRLDGLAGLVRWRLGTRVRHALRLYFYRAPTGLCPVLGEPSAVPGTKPFPAQDSASCAETFCQCHGLWPGSADRFPGLAARRGHGAHLLPG